MHVYIYIYVYTYTHVNDYLSVRLFDYRSNYLSISVSVHLHLSNDVPVFMLHVFADRGSDG